MPSDRSANSASAQDAAPWPSLELRGVAGSLPGRDLPGSTVDNATLAALSEAAVDRLRRAGVQRAIPPCDPEFPRRRVGIEARCILDEDLSARDLAVDAGHRALLSSGVAAEDVVAVVVSTVTPDRPFPSVASSVAGVLGLERVEAAIDASIGCNGFLVALDVAARQLATRPPGAAALVVAAEALSRWVDVTDRTTAPIFGDGAGAVVLVRGEESRLGPVHLRCLPRGAARITTRTTPPTTPPPRDTSSTSPRPESDASEPLLRLTSRNGRPCLRVERGSRQRIALQGRRVFRDMVRLLPEFVSGCLRADGTPLDAIDRFAPHQANQRMLEAVFGPGGLDVDPERCVGDLARTGNTASASIPLLLAHANATGRLHPGERVLLLGFGTGYSIGATTLQWT